MNSSKSYIANFILCVTFLLALATSFAQKINAVKGVIDLRNVDFSSQNIGLSGEWSFYWNKLLTPEEIQNEQKTVYTQYPVLWNKTILNNKSLLPIGYSTYGLTVLLPPKHPQLAMMVPDVYTSYKLFINGKVFSANGVPAKSKEKYIPHWITYTLPLPDTNTLQLVIQVANFEHSKGGPYKEIVIGEKERMLLSEKREYALDYLLTGAFMMAGLFFFGLFLFGRYDKATLYFSLFCIFYSYRIIGTKFYALHAVLPNLNWRITVELEYLTLYFSILFLLFYVKHLFKEDASFLFIRILSWLCAGLIVFTLLTPPVIFTTLITPFLVIAALYILYAIFLNIKAVINKRAGAKISLLSIGVLMLIFGLINLQYFGLVGQINILVFIGYISFVFLQSLIHSYRFAYALQNAKEQAEAGLKARSNFLSTMSHEIRTPLNSVIGTTHFLLQSKPREDQREQLDALLFSANNLLSLVNDILDYNKFEAGKIAIEFIDMDLFDLCNKVINGLKQTTNQKGIDLVFSFDNAIPHKLMGDPIRLNQVITNLLNNAIKFTNGGTVSLKLQAVNLSDTEVNIRFSVTDTGIGIPAEKHQYIFEQFTQADSSISRSYGGTGLGLSICKHILSLYGAELHLHSEVDKGSEFYFSLPFIVAQAKEEVPVALQEQAKKEKDLSGIYVLLVDDNDMNVFVARNFLQRWGAQIDVAHNGEDAIEVLDVTKHDIILMDMHMPIMDGYTASKIIRSKGIHIPIIALTASLLSNKEQLLKEEVAMNDVILKPFKPDDLYAVVYKYASIYIQTKKNNNLDNA
jgi:signal transduction histidine kinase/CheY-like chemotaxis protein